MRDEGHDPQKSFRRRQLPLGCVLAFVLLACIASAVWGVRALSDSVLELPPPERLLEPGTPTGPEDEDNGESLPGVPTTEGQPESSGESGSGRIVFVSPGGRLGTVDSDGGELRFIGESLARTFLFPAWSPDAARIAVLGLGDSGGGVYVLEDAVQGATEELYLSQTAAPIYLYWRPDGEALSYITSGENALNLFLSSIDGNDEPQLLVEGQPVYWDWLDNQSGMLVHTGTPLRGGQLTTVDAGNAATSEFEAGEPGFFQAPSVSLNGENVAYAELDNGNRSIALHNVDTGEVKREAHEGAAAMSWSPLEQKLAFISPVERRPGIGFSFYGPLRLLDANTGAVDVLIDESVLAFFWAPDGQSIAYFTISARGAEQVAHGEARGRWRNSGKVRRQHEGLFLNLSIVQIAGGQFYSLIDFEPTEIFLTQFLPFFDQYALSHQLWAPDSHALVLPLTDDGRPRIYVVPVSGSGIRPLAAGSVAFWSPR